MKRVPRTFSVDQDIADHMRRNLAVTNISDWLNEAYRREFMSLEAKTKELEKIMRRAEELKEEIKALKQQQQTPLGQKGQKEMAWIRTEGVARIQRGATPEGIYKYFINSVASQEVSRRAFRILLQEELKRRNENERNRIPILEPKRKSAGKAQHQEEGREHSEVRPGTQKPHINQHQESVHHPSQKGLQ